MNLLVLGATSIIGSEIAAAFSADNNLLLVGRDRDRLREAAELCRRAGARLVTEIPCDLAGNVEPVVAASVSADVGLIVDAASSTSRLRDDNIQVDRLLAHVAVDLMAPLQIVQHVAARRDGRLDVVYVSSVLAVVRTPNRSIYGELKALHESALAVLAADDPRVTPFIFRIATVVDPDRRSARAGEVARAVRRAYDGRRPITMYGVSGRVLAAVYRTQPWVIRGLVLLRRFVHQRLHGSVRHSSAVGGR